MILKITMMNDLKIKDMIQNRYIQIVMGAMAAFIITLLIYHVLGKTHAVFSAFVVALSTGIGIWFGGTSKND